FWADVTKPHAENNTTDVLLNVQTAIYSCKDRIQLTTTINYLKNVSEDQIKEIILRAEFKKKEKIIESYIKFPEDTKPQWFFKNIKEIDNLRQKLLELPITDLFYCFIVNFNSEIWQSIYSKNAILHLEKLNSDLDELLQEYFLDELLQHYHLHGSEHPATCTGEQKSSHHQPPFGSPSTSNHAQEYFKDIDNKEGKLLSEEINLRVYPQKVDATITYTYKGYSLYLLMCEVKLPNASNSGIYNKLIQSLNDAINDFVIFFSKTAKIISSVLKLHFSKMRWIGLFVFEKLRFTWLECEGDISTSFEKHDVGSIIEIYLVVKVYSSQEGSIQAFEYLQQVI
ncbi:6909_t:CDS:2, partial [Gigaspora margarita]